MTTQSSKLGNELKSMIKGSVLVTEDPGYEEARQIWNAMIDRRPAMIVQCAAADDVPTAIAFARRNKLEISIRGAGHNIAGNALCDGAGENDLFGCGSLGATPSETCVPLDHFSSNTCGALGDPWQCPDSFHELATVTKPAPAAGGILCCRD